MTMGASFGNHGPLVRAPSAPLARPPKVGFFRGAGAFYEGLAFIVTTPATWPRAMVPMAMALGIGGIAFGLGAFGAVHAADAIVAGSAAWAVAGRWILRVLFIALAGGIALLAALALAQPLSGWALDGIVRRREKELGVATSWPEAPLSVSIPRSIGVSLLGLAAGVPLLALLFVIELLFPPAAFVCVPLKFLVGALLVAWDFLDYPFSLRGMGVGARLAWIGRNFGAFLGFGLSAGTFLVIPFVGLLVLPMGVAGAATLAVKVDEGTGER